MIRRLIRRLRLALGLWPLCAALLCWFLGCKVTLPAQPDAGAGNAPAVTGGSAGQGGAAGEASTGGQSARPCRALINPRAADVRRGSTDRGLWAPRIVGGTATPLGAQPSAVALETESGFPFCGGTLVGDGSEVVTAAHCEVRVGEMVAVGLNDLRQAGNRIAVAEVRSSPDWTSETMHADWAVLRLSSSALAYPRTAPARLVAAGWGPEVKQVFRVFGWGLTSEGGSASSVLRQVDVPWASCSAYAGITGTMFCAGAVGLDSCQGDSGGGLYTLSGELAGIVSWGEGCARETPGVYTSIGSVREDLDACL